MQVHGFFTVLAWSHMPSRPIPARARTGPERAPAACGCRKAKLASISLTVQGCHPRAPVGRKGCPPTTMALACVGIDGCFGDDVNSDETRGPETTIQAPAGTLGISFGSDDTSNVIIAVRPTSPLAGSVAVGDKLISISGRPPHLDVGAVRVARSSASCARRKIRATASSRLKSRRRLRSRHHRALGLIFESHGQRRDGAAVVVAAERPGRCWRCAHIHKRRARRGRRRLTPPRSSKGPTTGAPTAASPSAVRFCGRGGACKWRGWRYLFS